jgi:hypothetical protein
MRGNQSYTAKVVRASSKMYKKMIPVNWLTVSFDAAAVCYVSFDHDPN